MTNLNDFGGNPDRLTIAAQADEPRRDCPECGSEETRPGTIADRRLCLTCGATYFQSSMYQ